MTGSETVVNGCAASFPSNPSAPRNIYTVNTTCVYTTDFGAYVGCVWNHEEQHLSAAVESAKNSSNDVYALWEPMVGQTAGYLQTVVQGTYSAANARVFDDAQDAHSSMIQYQRTFWYNTGTGWYGQPFNQIC